MKNKIRIQIYIVMIVMMIVQASSIFAGEEIQWERYTLDRDGRVGLYTSSAVSGDNTLGVTYYDEKQSRLLYMYKGEENTEWQKEEIDNESVVGSYSSLAYDQNNIPHVSYYDEYHRSLKYATYDISNEKWLVKTIDNSLITGRYTDILITKNQEIYISYYDFQNRALCLIHKKIDEDEWCKEVLDTHKLTGKYTSIAEDQNGNIGISYYNSTEKALYYCYFNAQTHEYKTEKIDGDKSGSHTSLVFNKDNEPTVAYKDEENSNLKYALLYQGATKWQVETVDDTGWVGGDISMIEIGGKPYISYYSEYRRDLYFAYKEEGEWIKQIVDASGLIGKYASLTYLKDKFYITYYDSTNTNLKIAIGQEYVERDKQIVVSESGSIINEKITVLFKKNESEAKIYKTDKKYIEQMKMSPLEIDEYIMLPMEDINKIIGGTVTYNKGAGEISVTYGYNQAKFNITENVPDMEVKGHEKNGYLYLPLEFVGKIYNMQVKYNKYTGYIVMKN